jgi:hypothetical protein
MLNLKLAEYDLKTGKFLRFLEIGKDFGYFGCYLTVEGIYESKNLQDSEHATFAHVGSIEQKQCDSSQEGIEESYSIIRQDETDPLNRFSGLFNGKTYGKGRFVLIQMLNNKDYETAYYLITRTF